MESRGLELAALRSLLNQRLKFSQIHLIQNLATNKNANCITTNQLKLSPKCVSFRKVGIYPDRGSSCCKLNCLWLVTLIDAADGAHQPSVVCSLPKKHQRKLGGFRRANFGSTTFCRISFVSVSSQFMWSILFQFCMHVSHLSFLPAHFLIQVLVRDRVSRGGTGMLETLVSFGHPISVARGCPE